EMKTGEGKTLSSVAAAYLNSLNGQGVHIVTVNDYLAERDADWMRPVYDLLGISVGTILSLMDPSARKIEYSKDITYGTNNELGFDYLRDNMKHNNQEGVQRKHHYCIIDEIDSILIDEARTPLIISGAAEDDTSKFIAVNRIVRNLKECEKDPATGDYPEDPSGDYKLDEKSKRVTFTDEGINNIEKLLLGNSVIRGSLFDAENFEYIHYATQALKAHKMFHKDVDYVVQEGKVEIVDEFTGRILHGRRYSEGLHQAIEAKENIQIARRNRTLATITFQNYFRMYEKISGMTGTADTEAREFAKIYDLEVVVIPTNRPVMRLDNDDVIYFNEEFKYEAICDEIERLKNKGQPVLVGTVSIEKSELLSNLLAKRRIQHEVLNAKNHAREALIVAEAGAKGSVTIATNMAGRGTDIKLGGNPEFRARRKAGTEASDQDYRKIYQQEYQNWLDDYREVKDLGGLYILGTERHESRRIDNQLRGRSGRQGDPGESRFFLSLDDTLMRLFARDNIKALMGRIGMAGGDPLIHPWVNKAIEKAQTRVEERNFEIRKHLLDYDNVLNEQRSFIYEQRNAILNDENILENRVYSIIDEICDDAVESCFRSSENDQIRYNALSDELKHNFYYELPCTPEQLKSINAAELAEKIKADLHNDINEKMELVGKNNFNMFIKFEYLRDIDIRWQTHLEELEALREAVGLRSYGQKNPLLEYKLEGFEIFDKLIQSIRTSIGQKVVKVKIRSDDASGRRQSVRNIETRHSAMGQFGGTMPMRNSAPQQAQPQKVQIKRAVPKVGRNEPCPCGSGKKYKHCCGA
ncbi:MAG: preprotein translocase subunit SecA, partial [Spirochaetales bacterium]|nr:preprotein translocase subunit SecA [Spirochaetales bacterium]